MDEGEEAETDPNVVDERLEGLLRETVLLKDEEDDLGTPARHEQDDHQNQHLDHLEERETERGCERGREIIRKRRNKLLQDGRGREKVT